MKEIAAGRYSTADEYVCELIRVSRESSGYGKLVRCLIRVASACRGLMIKL